MITYKAGESCECGGDPHRHNVDVTVVKPGANTPGITPGR